MKLLLGLSLLLLSLGILGVASNIYTGLFLSRMLAAESDFHLTIALSSVASLIIGCLGLIRGSDLALKKQQERILLSANKEQRSLATLSHERSRAVSQSLFLIVCCVINLISGTISQSGRFPLVHGLFGFALGALALGALIFWSIFVLRLLKESPLK